MESYSRFPAMTMEQQSDDSPNSNKHPYSFAPSYKSKTYQKVITGSAEYLNNDSIGKCIANFI
jgi:hypothetical protein